MAAPPGLRSGSDRLSSISESMFASWQQIVDLLVSFLNLPAALIMRAGEEEIEVFVTSQSDGNPYQKGDREHLWGSGLYCERVIGTQKPLCVPNAMVDPEWDHNPDIELNMVSYLGYPISFPDGAYFGTICVLDNQPKDHSPQAHRLVEQFRNVLEANLALIQIGQELGFENQSMRELLDSIRTLKGTHPICCKCKMIRNENEAWENIAGYISRKSEALFTHTLCPDCFRELYPDLAAKPGDTE